LTLTLALALVLGPAASALAKALDFLPCLPDQYYTIRSEHGETLAKMALPVTVGDYLVTEDNRGFRVASVQGRTARAKFDRWVDLRVASDRPPLGERIAGWAGALLAQVRGDDRKPEIGIYHTHSGEAYVPNTGRASLPTGDIYRVGATLREALQRRGLRADHSFNNHNPHDAAAYHRSRRTAMELIRRRPAAIFDIHRDGIPDADYYRKRVAGETIAQVRLVVGKQNQNRAVNFDFAKQIKAEADRIHPGLVKEIFWAKGNYNQDLAPRTVLVEFGTHLNSREMAQRAANLLADVLPVVLTGRRTAAPQPRPQATGVEAARGQNRTAGRSALWIALAAIVGGGLFLAINAGTKGGSLGRQLKKLTGQELSGFLGRYRGRPPGAEGDRKGDRPPAKEPREGD
jgi:stage II sporulation protein P